MALKDFQNKTPKVEILPDMRKRVTRVARILNYAAFNEISYDSKLLLPWATPDEDYPECRLIHQDELGQGDNAFNDPNNPPPQLVYIFEEIPANDRVIDGLPGVSFDQYGTKVVVIDYLQFSAGTTIYINTVGATVAPSPNADTVLKTVESTNDGTLIRSRLTFVSAGILADNEERKFDDKLLIRTLTYLNQVPPTPSGYTLITKSKEYVAGLPVYRYGFVNAGGSGGGGGSGSEIGRSYVNNQGGDVEFDPSSPEASTGEVICIITFITPTSVTSNPITGPSGFKLFALDVQDEDGFLRWVGRYGFGGGEPITVSVEGERDGALNYTVSQNDSDGTLEPDYPGSGTAYCIALTHTRDNGFFRNTAVWKKIPPTITLEKVVNFKMPGLAQFSSNNLILIPPNDRTLMADQEISYDTTQNTATPYSVDYGVFLAEAYIRTNNNSVGEGRRETLGYILGDADGISGTNSEYNGIMCDSFTVTLNSSSPTSRPSGLTLIDKDNSIYLIDVDGTVVYRRIAVTFTF